MTFKTIYKNFIFRLYRNWKKEEGAGARSFFVWFVIGLSETLICAIAEDKVCDSCIVSSWALLIFLLCLWWPNSNFLCCGITQNGESSRDLLLSVTNRKALAPRPPTPYRTFITLLPVTFSQLDPQLGVGWGKRLVLLIGYLLTDGFNCLTQIFGRFAFGIKGCSSKTRFISSIIRLLCPALWHYVREHIIYTVYSDCVLVFAFAFLSCKKKKKKICFKQDFLHWIIQKLAKFYQDFKE